MILFLFGCLFGYKSNAIYPKIKEELENNRTNEKDDIAVKWALAKLGDHISHTITSNQVEDELTSKIGYIIEKYDIINSQLENEFIQMKMHFMKTKKSLFEMVETSKLDILNEMQYFINEFNYSILNTVESAKPIHESYVNNSHDNIGEVYSSIMILFQNTSILFFFCFQIILVIGIINFYKTAKA